MRQPQNLNHTLLKQRLLTKNLLKDIHTVKEDFPSLEYITTSDSLVGEIDVFNDLSEYVETFTVSIKIPSDYPCGVPVAHELSKIIMPRGDKRHISVKGELCLDIPHKLELLALTGLTLQKFTKEILYPYLVNQCYFNLEKCYAGEEYDHGLKGIVQLSLIHI